MKKTKKIICTIFFMFILSVSIFAQSKSQRWEYDVIVQNSNISKYDLANILSNKGNNGWELIQIIVDKEGNWIIIFKKNV